MKFSLVGSFSLLSNVSKANCNLQKGKFCVSLGMYVHQFFGHCLIPLDTLYLSPLAVKMVMLSLINYTNERPYNGCCYPCCIYGIYVPFSSKDGDVIFYKL